MSNLKYRKSLYDNQNAEGFAMKYRVFWDLGDLDCRDIELQRKLGMSMNQIINADEEYLEELVCRIYGLPLVVSQNQLSSIKNRSYRGFKIYRYECL